MARRYLARDLVPMELHDERFSLRGLGRGTPGSSPSLRPCGPHSCETHFHPQVFNSISKGTFPRCRVLGDLCQGPKPRLAPSLSLGEAMTTMSAILEATSDDKLQLDADCLRRTRVDVGVEPDAPDVAPVQYKSPLIPRCPFRRREVPDWYQIQNLRDCEMYYFNERMGETQTLESEYV